MRKAVIGLFAVSLLFSSCDRNRVFDDFTRIEKGEWSYKKPVSFLVDIPDTSLGYNFYFNIRHSGDYPYSNLWVVMKVEEPGKKERTERFEFTLAEPDGRWLGKGLGDMYTYRILLQENAKFRQKGIYRFTWEQNMRDEPLTGIKDVGMRVEEFEKN